jgi:hypothetical protein
VHLRNVVRQLSPWAGLVVQILIVLVGFGGASILAQTNLLASFLVLLVTGAIVGIQRGAGLDSVAIGSALGAVTVDLVWLITRERRSEPLPDAILGSLPSAVVLGLVLGGLFVLPGYLFGRAWRRSSDTPAWGPFSVEGAAGLDHGPSTTTYVAGGCLILLLVGVMLLWLLSSLSHWGY